MEESARPKLPNYRTQVLITGAGSYLGSSLVDSQIQQNCHVFGVGNSRLLSPFLSKENFTLLELDLTQPLPSYLPEFDLIFHLDEASYQADSFATIDHFSPQTKSIISLTQSKVILIAPLSFGVESPDYLIKDEATKARLRVFLIGDLYGPKMPTGHLALGPVQKELASLIAQAVNTDKVILEDEGLDLIYPTYITDAVFAINKFAFSPKTRDVQIIVSEEAISSLSAAYEIQNVASMVTSKQLGLFFAGPPSKNKTAQKLLLSTSHLGFDPKVKLTEGLKQTFEYFKDRGLIPAANQLSREYHPINLSPPSPRLRFQEAAESSFPQKLRLKVPKFTPSLRLKNLLILLLLIIFASSIKTGLDVYLGASRLNAAKKALMSANFDKAKSKAKSAQISFKAAQNKFNILSFPLSLVFPQKIKSTKQAIESAVVASQSLFYFSLGGQTLSKDFSLIMGKQANLDGLDLESPAADFRQALFFSSKAVALSAQAQKSAVFATKIESLKDSFTKLYNLSSSALEVTQLVGDATGAGSPKTYLLLLQNNTELRPGGGFIGNFGTLEFEGGKLKAVNVDDIYTIDGQLKEKIEPPRQLKEKLGIDNFYLRDSNWSADFALNSATAQDLFKKETGKNVDGVIAFDLTFIQDVLEATGPIKLEDYNEEISSKNLFERGEYYSEVGFFPGSTQKRDFFGALSNKLISQILSDIAQQKASPLISLVQVAKADLQSRHVLVSFDNPTLGSYVATHGWDSPLPPRQFDITDTSQTRDFLAISEANLGANKVNRFLERKIAYEVTVGRDADLVGRLTITYTNNSQAETWPAGKYVNFLRVYVPAGSNLSEVKNGDITDLKSTEVTTTGPLTTFATYVQVPIKSTKQVSFVYKIPKNIKLENAPTYHLYIQKQPGTEKDSLEFKFNLPGYLKTKSVNDDEKYSNMQNLTIQTDLAVDRQFEIEVAKK